MFVLSKNQSSVHKVGKCPNAVWDFQGVFTSEERALEACKDRSYFVGPAVLNKELPYDTIEWPGHYYPKMEKEDG